MTEAFLRPLQTSLSALGLLGASLATIAVPTPAYASDWGCQVALCLATPGSPTQYAECVPPITKLWNVLAMGGSFPTCTEGGVATRMSKIGSGTYWLRMTMPDGSVNGYTVSTKHSTITPSPANRIPETSPTATIDPSRPGDQP